MSYTLELHSQIDRLSKKYDLSANQKFSLAAEAGAICFLLDASDEVLRSLLETSNFALADQTTVATMARGLIAELRLKGVDATNAKQYFADKLSQLEAQLLVDSKRT